MKGEKHIGAISNFDKNKSISNFCTALSFPLTYSDSVLLISAVFFSLPPGLLKM